MNSHHPSSLPAPLHVFREPFSTISHLVGLGIALLLLPLLLLIAGGRVLHTIGAIAFGGALILLYLASSLLHGVKAPRKILYYLEQFDYVAIFLLIVGTYVPVCLVTLDGPFGRGLLVAEIGLAIAGILLALVKQDKAGRAHVIHTAIRLCLYLIMGWLVIIGMNILIHSLPPTGLMWLVAGGVVYSLGAVVFAMDRPHLIPGRFSAHDLWHLFVLGGSLLHAGFIVQYVLLPGSWLMQRF